MPRRGPFTVQTSLSRVGRRSACCLDELCIFLARRFKEPYQEREGLVLLPAEPAHHVHFERGVEPDERSLPA